MLLRLYGEGHPELKRRIRQAAEEEERRTYTERMPDEWRRALAPLGAPLQLPRFALFAMAAVGFWCLGTALKLAVPHFSKLT